MNHPVVQEKVLFWGTRKILKTGLTLEDNPMDPENHWLAEEHTLPGGPGRQGLCEFSRV